MGSQKCYKTNTHTQKKHNLKSADRQRTTLIYEQMLVESATGICTSRVFLNRLLVKWLN